MTPVMPVTRWMACAALAACTTHDTPARIDPPPGSTYGTVYATNTDAQFFEGSQGSSTAFDLDAQTGPLAAPPSAPCAGASSVVGACCYLPASAVSTMPAEIDIGTIDFTDQSSGATLGALPFGGGAVSTGSNGSPPTGYFQALANPARWQEGDSLLVQGLGDGPYAAFSASLPGLVVPQVTIPTLARAQTMTFAWAPDANAQTMTVTLSAAAANGDSHGEVTCVVLGAASGVTIDASLTTAFVSGDTVSASFSRETDRYAEIAGGYVTIASLGVHSVSTQLP